MENSKGSYTYIVLEANPTIYQTNFINTKQEAIEFTKMLNHTAIAMNYDLGTDIYYNNKNINDDVLNISIMCI